MMTDNITNSSRLIEFKCGDETAKFSFPADTSDKAIEKACQEWLKSQGYWIDSSEWGYEQDYLPCPYGEYREGETS